jgi:hypothetical protein
MPHNPSPVASARLADAIPPWSPACAPAAFPGLPRLVCVPRSCVAYELDDASAAWPLQPGDVIVVNRRRRRPEHGGLFLVARRNRSGARAVEIAELVARDHDGNTGVFTGWWIALALGRRDARRLLDGPCSLSGIAAVLRGRVIGILDPAGPAATLPSPDSTLPRLAAAGRWS